MADTDIDYRRALPLHGIWLPLITPFRDGALDEASLRRLLRHYAGQSIQGLILAATTGEGMTLDWPERRRLVELTAAEVGSRWPLILGLAGSDTREMAAALAATAGWPIGGYLITCPSYVRPSQEGLYQHFAALAATSTKPIALYNIPYRTGVNLSNATLFRLTENPIFVGIKDCCVDAGQSFDLIRGRPPGFAVLTGEDALTYNALAQGADGAILAAAHVETARFAAVHAALKAGNLPAAREAWNGVVDLVRLLFAEPNPAPIKHWLARQGLIASPELRLPMAGVSAGLADRLAAELARRVAVPA